MLIGIRFKGRTEMKRNFVAKVLPGTSAILMLMAPLQESSQARTAPTAPSAPAQVATSSAPDRNDGPQALVSDGKGSIWVANRFSNTVSKLQGGRLVATYKVGNRPTGLAFDGTHVWVSNLQSDTVMKLSASTGALLATIPVKGRPGAMTYDGSNLWVVCRGAGAVTKISAALRNHRGFISRRQPAGGSGF